MSQTRFHSQIVPKDTTQAEAWYHYQPSVWGCDANGVYENGTAPGNLGGISLPTGETAVAVIRLPWDLDPTAAIYAHAPVSFFAAAAATDDFKLGLTYTKDFTVEDDTGAVGDALVDPATATGVSTTVGTVGVVALHDTNFDTKVLDYWWTIAANTFAAANIDQWTALGITATLTGITTSEYTINGLWLNYTRRFL